MWIAVVAGVVAGWILLAVGLALVIGRAVHLADRRRPRARRRRAAAALQRAVRVATGAIPIIRPQVLRAVTGTLPVIRPRID